MRLTIIKDDDAVYIDGKALTVDCSALPNGLHAVQWYDTWGEVETNIDGKQGNQRITDISPYQSYVDAWNAANAKSKI